MILGLPIYKFIAFIVLNVLYLGIIIFLRIDAWRLEKQCIKLKNDNDSLSSILSCKNDILKTYKNKDESFTKLLDKENFDES